MAKRKSKSQILREDAPGICKVPRQLPTVSELMDQYSRMTSRGLATALGVSERTVYRWRMEGGSRIARVAVWWLTWEGHAHWDHEMHQRTVMALQMNEVLMAANRRLEARVSELESLLFADPEVVTLADDLVDQVEVVESVRNAA